jgi:chemotaxis protein CheY-P-specific phosphatase CheC
METDHKLELERIAHLTHVGALRAAAAFGQLVSAPVEAGRPVVRDCALNGPSGATARVDDSHEAVESTGVFFEFEGCLDALVGILFPAAGSERLVRSIVGIESGALDPTIVESALMEVGNILASHVASGIADALHSRLLPSIPALAQGDAEREFEAWVERVAGEPATHVEAVLALESGEKVGRLVVVPTHGFVDTPGRSQR